MSSHFMKPKAAQAPVPQRVALQPQTRAYPRTRTSVVIKLVASGALVILAVVAHLNAATFDAFLRGETAYEAGRESLDVKETGDDLDAMEAAADHLEREADLLQRQGELAKRTAKDLDDLRRAYEQVTAGAKQAGEAEIAHLEVGK